MRWILQGILILSLALTLVYGLASNFDFLFEDQGQLAAFPRNPSGEDYRGLWTRPTSVLERTWRPIAHTTLMAQRGTSGLEDAWPYRLLNVFLLGLAGFLAAVLFRLSPFEFRRIPLMMAMLAWILHPAATGAIYRIVIGREILLMMIFSLGSLILYFREGFFFRLGSLLLFALALGSHEMAWVLPLLIAVAEGVKLTAIPSRRNEYRSENTPLVYSERSRLWKQWLGVLAFFVVLGVYGFFRARAFAGEEMGWRPERMPWRALWYTIQTTFLPLRDVLHQPTWPVWWSGWRLFGALWIVLGMIVLCVFCLFRTDLTPIWGRSEETRRLAFLVAWFLFWIPSLAAVWTREPSFDELSTWPAGLAVFGVLAWVGTRVWSEIAFRQEAWVLGVSLIVVFMAISFSRRIEHRSDDEYVAHWQRRDPGAVRRLEQQGRALAERGRWDDAEFLARRGLKLAPENRALLTLRREALVQKERWEEALLVARELAREGDDTDRENLADALMKVGRNREASDLYTLLAEKYPENRRLREKLERSLAAEQEELPSSGTTDERKPVSALSE